MLSSIFRTSSVAALWIPSVITDGPSGTVTWETGTAGTGLTFSESDMLVIPDAVADWQNVWTTFARTTGKYYWELEYEGTGSKYSQTPGLTNQLLSAPEVGKYSHSFGWHPFADFVAGGSFSVANATGGYAAVQTDGEYLMFAVDLDAGKLWCGFNNAWTAGGDPAAGTGHNIAFSVGTTGALRPGTSIYDTANTHSIRLRVASGGFLGTVPSGFLPWQDD